MGIRKSSVKNKKSKAPAAAASTQREETVRRAVKATARRGRPSR